MARRIQRLLELRVGAILTTLEDMILNDVAEAVKHFGRTDLDYTLPGLGESYAVYEPFFATLTRRIEARGMKVASINYDRCMMRIVGSNAPHERAEGGLLDAVVRRNGLEGGE